MNKDWTGNKKTTFATLGSSSHSDHDREQHDYYATDPSAIEDLFSVENFSQTIWEPSCGEGHLSKKMEEQGKDVLSTDLVDRGYGKGGIDFLQSEDIWNGDIITNPPYKFAQEFIEHALTLISKSEVADQKIAMFLKLTFLEGQKRQRLFRRTPPYRIYVYSFRKKCAINGKFHTTGSSAACYAWFVWLKDFKGEPVVKWITK